MFITHDSLSFKSLLYLQHCLSLGLGDEEVVENVGGEGDGGVEPVSSMSRHQLQHAGEQFSHNKD